MAGDKPTDRDIDYSAIAAQLAKPTGADGLLVAQRMNQSNGEMTRKAIELLHCQAGQHILEIGPGNAQFAGYVLQQAENLQYAGTDISETMIAEGLRINQQEVLSGKVSLQKTDGSHLPYPDQTFDSVFSVNTIYFWENPDQFIREIHRVLRNGGLCCLAFASREFMQTLPFTDERFKLYNKEEVETLLKNNGFRLLDSHTRIHKTTSAAKIELDREEIFVQATV